MNRRCFPLLACVCFIAGAGFARDTAGIGIAVGARGDTLFVASVLPSTPAAANRALKVNDRIVAIGQGDAAPVSTTGMKIEQVVKMIRGPAGTVVGLTLVAAGDLASQAHVVSFVRGELEPLSDWGDGVLLPTGSSAPAVKYLRLSDNRDELLADYRGKIVVLEFWTTWCAPCQGVMRRLQELAKQHPEWQDKVAWIAVNIDERRELAVQRLAERNWNRTHNVWATMNVVRAFHVGGIPTPYVLDSHGKVVAAGNIDLPVVLGRLLH